MLGRHQRAKRACPFDQRDLHPSHPRQLEVCFGRDAGELADDCGLVTIGEAVG